MSSCWRRSAPTSAKFRAAELYAHLPCHQSFSRIPAEPEFTGNVSECRPVLAQFPVTEKVPDAIAAVRRDAEPPAFRRPIGHASMKPIARTSVRAFTPMSIRQPELTRPSNCPLDFLKTYSDLRFIRRQAFTEA
jgi:hypothetical protein